MIPSTKGWRLAVLGLVSVWLLVVCTLDSSRPVPHSPSLHYYEILPFLGNFAQYYFSTESDDLKNPLCRPSSYSPPDSFWIFLSSELRR